MNSSAETEIMERRVRLKNIASEHGATAWVRELTDEITRLRYDLREIASQRRLDVRE